MKTPANATLVLVAMTLANAMILVDQTAVPLTLPDILEDFRIGSSEVQWVLSGSLLSLTALLVLGGKLGDLLGRRRIFLVGLSVFTAASAVAGFAPDFWVLLVARFVQGAGGALVLPATIAIVSAAYPPERRGRALGTMGGVAAVAGALGPTIGGGLTSGLSWRAVFLVNVPLAVVCAIVALRAVPADGHERDRIRIDGPGTVLLAIFLVGLVFGLSSTQTQGWGSAEVVVPLIACVVALVAFLLWERRAEEPLVDIPLLARNRNYLGASTSQALAGMAEMGLGVIFPLLLILNLGMDPGLAGLALIPATIPMVVLAPLVGRWYDRVGGRPPLAVGFAILALSGIALAIAAQLDAFDYVGFLPGLLLYGTGLALVLTANDPVTLDMLPASQHGQASGVSATAEQGGGALGIAVLYALFHSTYLSQIRERIDEGPLRNLSAAESSRLRDEIVAAEQTGLRPSHFDPELVDYLPPAGEAAFDGYSVAFAAVAVIAVIGLAVTALLVRHPAPRGALPASGDPARRRSG